MKKIEKEDQVMKNDNQVTSTKTYFRMLATGIITIWVALSPSLSFAEWDFFSVWEADSHSNGYVFTGIDYFYPLTLGLGLATSVIGNYLYYSLPENAGETKVKSPGVFLLAGPRLSGKKISLTVMAGAELRTIQSETETPTGKSKTNENEVSPLINAALSAQLGQRWNFLGIAYYSTACKDIWTRGGLKYQITGSDKTTSISLGPEITLHRDPDISSIQYGGMIEVYHLPGKLSIAVRSGYKRSTFDVGASREGPYWGIDFYKAF